MKSRRQLPSSLLTAALFALTLPLLLSCAGESNDHHDRAPMDPDHRTVRQDVSLSNLDNGCSTAGLQGLSEQLLDEMQCLTGGDLVPVSHPNIVETTDRVHTYLSPSGRDRLESAADRATIRINSALRTIAEQYSLWKGCPVAADPGTSNHETGRAIDVDNYPSVGDILKSEGFSQPLPDSDPVHFEGPGKDLREFSVLAFQKLWNANNPNDQIAEDGISGQETISRLAQAPADGFQLGSVCSDQGGDNSSYDAAMEVSARGGDGRVETGSSSGIRDLLPGERFEASIRLTNKSDSSWSNPRIGYSIEEPFLDAVDYTIQDDHPEHDRDSWERNDANDNPENPEQLGERGMLYLNGMSPGESKRVTVTMEATRYSFGRGLSDHASIRGWLWKVDGVYEEQTAFDGEPSDTNEIGRRVRDETQVDVFDHDQWLFRGGNDRDFEAWEALGSYGDFFVDTDARSLAIEATGSDASLLSPDWTRIDSSRFDELVLRTRNDQGQRTIQISFRRAGEEFSDARIVRFRAPGDGDFHRFVVPVGLHPEWGGTPVQQLRIDPFVERTPPENGGWRSDFAELYFQDSDAKKTSSDVPAVEYAAGKRVELLDIESDSTDDGGPSADAGSFSDASGPSSSNRSSVTTRSTCSAPADRPLLLPNVLLAVFFSLVPARRLLSYRR